jgi:hypothetical protein
VIRISLAHPLYLYGRGNSPAEPPKEFGQVARILTFHKPNRCRGVGAFTPVHRETSTTTLVNRLMWVFTWLDPPYPPSWAGNTHIFWDNTKIFLGTTHIWWRKWRYPQNHRLRFWIWGSHDLGHLHFGAATLRNLPFSQATGPHCWSRASSEVPHPSPA